tara:strand:+ start:471 stop:857 length:387 start_codon:yes stop_codon:yes gene_type:complete
MVLNRVTTILGWFFSVAVSLVFVMGAVVQITFDPSAEPTSAAHYPDWFHMFVGIGFLLALVLHLIPKSSFALFGAILMTAFFGGIIGTHLLLDDGQWWTRWVIGLLPWLGLYLRDQQFNNLMSFWRNP